MGRTPGSSRPDRRKPAAPAAPPGEPYVAVRETHTSVVLLLGDRAYKVKKPVALPFLDLSTREARVADCLHEVELNRRIAPDVYLGVDELRPLEGDTGDAGEPVVVMRRMPDSRRLGAMVQDPGQADRARRCALDAARQVAAFHAALPGIEGYDLVGTMTQLWDEGRAQTRVFEDGLLPAAALDEAHALAREYLGGREGMLRVRERAGLVRDGHGDLLTEDIFCLDDGARVLDCLEFDARLRVGDVLMDIAFLAMDLALHGAPDLARLVVDRYRELTAEAHPASLEHHYVAYRAWVRAKVECLRAGGGDPGAADRARHALDLCVRELRSGRVRLVLVGGLPGTGKSTLAQRIVEVDDREWVLLSSDEVRKELAGVPATTSRAAGFGEGDYDRSHTDVVYAELLRRAGAALSGGLCVVLDASWTEGHRRRDAAAVAHEHGGVLSQVRCVAPEEVCLERLTARAAGPHVSDATPEVRRRLATMTDPWPDALEVDTGGSVDAAAAALLRGLGSTPPPQGADEP
ncbi:MAG TPA: AAA family ATPase [Phycicoccus sp.]|nr:AAA family ATPase [Phycicoccus sp.]